ncbi:CDP-glycerol glycerophosphotransferase family protein [Terribacillus saccharophilus]|uniref:CDP-glycerol glycerophosphotransferase family protein n=1 Tax=Terribacillus saccharophilus TaxID=361277 RepID=UPI0039826392
MNKKVLRRRLNFIKDPVMNFLRKDNHRRAILYAKYFETLEVRDNVVLYESRDGKSLTDSPFAIFQYLLNHPDYQHLTHIWSVENPTVLEKIISQYDQYNNVKFVTRNTREYLKCLASAKFLVNNATFQSFFIPKDNQVYINTWHGTPLKSMGFDIPGNPAHSQNVVRNFLSASYLLSPNEHTTKMFTDSYKLKGLFEGEIIQEGYPRIDLTYNTDREEFIRLLKSTGVKINGQKPTILYAPTWKGTTISRVNNDVYQIMADMAYLENHIGYAYNLMVKVHPYLYDEALKVPELKDRLIPDYIDTNQMLSVTDILLTDYSSIFFDFMVTDKPILFYMWDQDEYSVDRGRYLDNSELPGPTLLNIREVLKAIKNIDEVRSVYKENYEVNKARFTAFDDGEVTKRIVSYIFNGAQSLQPINGLDKGKEKILIYPGGMMNNGITSSFINLLDNIDYSKYDVSCFMKTPHSKEALQNIAKVNKNARMLFKPGVPVYRLGEVYRDKHINNRGIRGKLEKKIYPEQAYRREHRRLFGKTHFDYVIDFSGYSLYWAKYLLHSDAKQKIVYMHNDLLSESEKIINGRRPHRVNLRGLFSAYHLFDKLVSVSKGTMELNRKNLSQYADESKFDYVMNSINPEKILKMSQGNNDHSEPDNTEHENSIETSRFKSRALIIQDDKFIWNKPFIEGGDASKVTLSGEFFQKEVTITRKAVVNESIYYKFTFEDIIIGWMEQDAFELLPDSIISKVKVNKLAKLMKTRGNEIWSKPYKVEGIIKKSTSNDLKNVTVQIDYEARTEHGMYSRIRINKHIIGWIDSLALRVIKDYDLDEKSKVRKVKDKVDKRVHVLIDQRKNKKVYKNLPNRTKQEQNVRFMAEIVKPEDHVIWSKAYPNMGTKIIGDASDYVGSLVTVTKVHRTRKGRYYLFSLNNKKVGWLDARAFEKVRRPIIMKKKQVLRKAKIELMDKELRYVMEYDVDGGNSIKLAEDFNGKTVSIVEEITTQKGTFCKFIYGNAILGWLNKNSFIIEETLGIESKDNFVMNPSPDYTNFVNMGRFSPEKGQDNLIKAFAVYLETNPNSRLYILGDGILRNELEALIEELGVGDSVFLTGQMDNPFQLMKQCDCFVLSSHYEGQPMVLLEAMTLGMKILATDIVANRTVLEDGRYGILVEDSVEGLIDGFHKVTDENENQVQPFDYEEYNKKAMDTFYSAFKNS